MTILRRLTLALAAIGVAAALLLTIAISGMRQLASSFDHTVSITSRKLELSGQIDTAQSDLYLAQRGLLIASFVHDAGRFARLKRDFDGSVRRVRQGLDELRVLETSPDVRGLLSG